MARFTLRERPAALQWAVLLGRARSSASRPSNSLRLPAALMLGAIAAAILSRGSKAACGFPPGPLSLAQGFIGCLVARAITPEIVTTIFRKWPMFLIMIGAVDPVRRRARLRAHPLEGASGHDGGLGLLGRRRRPQWC